MADTTTPDDDIAETRQVLVETRLAAPPDVVWRALRDPDQLHNWFGWEADSLDGEIAYIFQDHVSADVGSYTLTFEPFEGIADAFELEPYESGTLVRIARNNGAPVDWTAGYDELNEGWVSFLHQLRLLLDRHPGAARRTHYRSGLARPSEPLPHAALGIDALKDKPIGAEFMIDLPWGDTLTGTIWHRSHFQTGLAIPAYGDGLLILSDKSANESRPHGGGALLLTAFGMDEGEFTALAERWSDWWAGRYLVPAG